MKSLWGVGLLGFCAVVSGACLDLSGHSCEAVAYACEVTTVTFRSPSNGWTAGTYTLALVVDGETRQCDCRARSSDLRSGDLFGNWHNVESRPNLSAARAPSATARRARKQCRAQTALPISSR
jgi:hypothetical protein